MEERSLRVYQEKTFFRRFSNTLTKLLTPTKVGINGVLISIKRNNALKNFEIYKENEDIEDQTNLEALTKNMKTFMLYI